MTSTQYYYHRDHLSNNCAVWDATNDSVIQRTWYYASGTPMSVSTAQGIQPYKYNGKEYIESHGYDTYDYGFRGYYATIGRFTSIDPLTERTPWQSPYTYANNNWVNLIDYMGLAGSDAYTTSDQAKITKLLEYLSGGGDINSFDFDEEGWDACEVGKWWITSEGEFFYVYSVMEGDITGGMGTGYTLPECVVTLIHTKITSKEGIEKISEFRNSYRKISDFYTNIVSSIGATSSVVGNATCNELYWLGKNGKLYNWTQRQKGVHGNVLYRRSYHIARDKLVPSIGRGLGKFVGGVSMAITLYDVYNNGWTTSNIIDSVVGICSFIPGIGWMIGGAYAVADMGCILICGQDVVELLTETKK